MGYKVDEHTMALLHFTDPNNPWKDEISGNNWVMNSGATCFVGNHYMDKIGDPIKFQYGSYLTINNVKLTSYNCIYNRFLCLYE